MSHTPNKKSPYKPSNKKNIMFFFLQSKEENGAAQFYSAGMIMEVDIEHQN